MIAAHHIYHAGELNQVLSIYRDAAWEEGEEVEDNELYWPYWRSYAMINN
jgi:hypothetical protein